MAPRWPDNAMQAKPIWAMTALKKRISKKTDKVHLGHVIEKIQINHISNYELLLGLKRKRPGPQFFFTKNFYQDTLRCWFGLLVWVFLITLYFDPKPTTKRNLILLEHFPQLFAAEVQGDIEAMLLPHFESRRRRICFASHARQTFPQ